MSVTLSKEKPLWSVDPSLSWDSAVACCCCCDGAAAAATELLLLRRSCCGCDGADPAQGRSSSSSRPSSRCCCAASLIKILIYYQVMQNEVCFCDKKAAQVGKSVLFGRFCLVSTKFCTASLDHMRRGSKVVLRKKNNKKMLTI